MRNQAALDHHLSTDDHLSSALSHQGGAKRKKSPLMRRVTLGLVLAWLGLVAGLSWWASGRILTKQLDSVAASAEYEAKTTARVVDRLFIEMTSVANMVASQAQVIQLATRYRTDPPGMAELTREQRAAQLTRDLLVGKVGDFMNALSNDLNYARIYMTNLSDNTLTASNWAEPGSIVGMIYAGRTYLIDALRDGIGQQFGIARLNKSLSYFVASRIDNTNNVPQGVVTVKLDAPEMATYLTGQHTALIINRQGRVTTSSSEAFLLRNLAALLPLGTALPPDGGEELGEPMDVRVLPSSGTSQQWLIDGKPYLVWLQPLSNPKYQLLTLAALEHLSPMRKQHFYSAALVALIGLVLILLSSQTVGQMMMRRQEEQYAANYDALTGLPNRRAILAELGRLLVQAKEKHMWVLVAFIDLDGFKKINDTYGHVVGDKFLIKVGLRMSAGLREHDMLGRLGGDEFVIIGLANPSQENDPNDPAELMRRRLAPLLIGSYRFAEYHFDYAGASLGIVNVDPSTSSLQTVLKAADERMYADKKARQAQKTI